MDPDATYDTMMDTRLSLVQRTMAANDLLVWFAQGGIVPRDPQGDDARDTATRMVRSALQGWADDERMGRP